MELAELKRTACGVNVKWYKRQTLNMNTMLQFPLSATAKLPVHRAIYFQSQSCLKGLTRFLSMKLLSIIHCMDISGPVRAPGFWRLAAVLCMSTFFGLSASGQVVLLTSDAVGTSSITGATNWSNGQVPSSAYTYGMTNKTLRTPLWVSGSSSDTNVIFLGLSLTLSNKSTLLLQSTNIVTITNLILQEGGAITVNNFGDGVTVPDFGQLAGNLILTNGGGTSWALGAGNAFVNHQGYNISANISGTGALTLSGNAAGSAGLIVLSGSNTFSGGIANSYANLQVGGDYAIPNPATANEGDLTMAGTIATNLNTYATGPWAGYWTNFTGTFDLNGHNVTVNALNQAASYTPSRIFNTAVGTHATLTVGSGGDTAGFYGEIMDVPLLLTNWYLGAGGGGLTTGALTLNGGGYFTNGVGGTVSLTKVGTGTEMLYDTNTYSGDTTISGGALAFGGYVSGSSVLLKGTLPFGTGKGNLINNALLYLGYTVASESNLTVNGLSGSGVVSNSVFPATLQFGWNNVSSNYDGTFVGSYLSIEKDGSGTEVLSGLGGSSKIGGITTINGGTLIINGIFGTASVSVGGTDPVTGLSGGTLGGAGIITSLVNVNSSGTLAPGSNDGHTIGTLTLTNNGINSGTLQGALSLDGNLFFKLNPGLVQSNDFVSFVGTNTCLTNTGTGTLTLTNVGGNSLYGAEVFKLFSTNLIGGSGLTIAYANGGYTFSNELSINGNVVVLGNPTFSGLAVNPTAAYGAASVTLSGTVSASGPVYPVIGETVTVSINGNPQTTTINDTTGDFIINYNASTIPASSTPYPISYVYSGWDSILVGVTNSATTLTINKATPTLSVANSPVTYNGTQEAATFNESTPGTVSGVLYNGSATVPTVPGTYTVTADFTPVDTTDYTSLSGASAGNFVIQKAPTSMSATSSKNPSGYKSTVIFTASLPTYATGNVLFLTNGALYDTEPLSSGTATSVATTLLPRGTDTITVQYAGDANYIGNTNSISQVVTNHPPAAGVMTAYRTAGMTLRIALSDMATNWGDADGDTVELMGVNPFTTNLQTLFLLNVTSNGYNSFVITNTAFVGYTNGPNVSDQFSYSIADGQGGTNIGLVNIVILTNATGQVSGIEYPGGNAVTMNFAGLPGYTYAVQRSTNLDTGSGWVTIWTTNAPANGLFNYSDGFNDLGSKPASAYYRLSWQL